MNNFEANTVITIESTSGCITEVLILRETPKAILVKGNCSEAWFPKKGLDEDLRVAPWVTMTISHGFLWEAPYTAR